MLGADIILRDDEHFRGAAERRKLPTEDKESHRWIEGYRRANKLARDLPDTGVFSVSDREGDIFELYLEWQAAEGSQRAEWIVRGNQDRVLVDVEDEASASLFGAVREAPLLVGFEFEVPATTGTKKVKGNRVKTERGARKVRQVVRSMEITPRPPRRTGLKLCRVEYIQLKTCEALVRALGVYLVVAWRMHDLTCLERQCPDLPCGCVSRRWSGRRHARWSIDPRMPASPRSRSSSASLASWAATSGAREMETRGRR